MIMDFLELESGSNSDALLASALVSRSFCRASRIHTFGDILIDWIHWNNAQEFLDLTASQNCSFMQAIQRAKMDFVRGNDDSEVE